jgi:DNA-directed RNA polymerase subunit L/DNA-directed RNA polymerase alpha subunit
MNFDNLRNVDSRTLSFTLSPIHVTYANTLRRLILTGVETVAFRSDMTSTGSTTDVIVKRNDTPMTNEMLADRIGLIPINVTEPLKWNADNYRFTLSVAGNKDDITYVNSGNFKVYKKKSQSGGGNDNSNDNSNSIVSSNSNNSNSNVSNNSSNSNSTVNDNSNSTVSNNSNNSSSNVNDNSNSTVSNNSEDDYIIQNSELFFSQNSITGDTCLIATLQPGSGATQQFIEIEAKATKGTGREHARFIPVSQCSYEYTPDENPQRIEEMFQNWLNVAKKAGSIEKGSERYNELRREFNTMQIKRCFKVDEKNEPFSFDFTVETAGVLPVSYIIERACEVGENMCSRYVNIHRGELPAEMTVSSADSRIIGYDFLIRGHDHTLGNLLQTWLVQNHIEGEANPKITYAGYSVPHPLRDEMVLRIGVEDGEEATARLALAEAAKGCVNMFQKLRASWRAATGAPELPVSTPATAQKVIRRKPVSSIQVSKTKAS